MTLRQAMTPLWAAENFGNAAGAYPAGTRVTKSYSEEGDSTINGALGTVVASMDVPHHMRGGKDYEFAYFVEWDYLPDVAVGVLGYKITEEGGDNAGG